ncbi:MAG: hypothetical protein ABEK01_00455 [Candidatus Nanohaloarchaea archaeon]
METEKFREKKELEEVVERLDRDLDSVIVEGFEDRRMMRKLGFSGKVFMSAERSVEDLVEDVSRGAEAVAVLTDFDEHGKEESRKLTRELDREIDVVKSARKEFGAQLTSTGRRAVEDVRPLFQDREKKFVDAALDRLFFRD